ncbi:MAG: YebC/PmpR family DNA-binding transcriptional regulator, partial [Fimbriimonadales bacterium]
IEVARNGLDEDEFTLAAIDAGAEDVETDEETFTVYTGADSLHATNDALEKAGYKTSEVALTYKPSNMANPAGDDIAKLLKLLDALEDLDDVQETYVNVDITEDMFQEA